MPTPLYDSLRALAGTHPLRLDMPGHHGGPLPGGFPWPSEIDFTENGHTGDLYGGEPDAIQAAERLWAERFGFDSCLFLTGGSTQGIHAGLALLAGEGGPAALDRGSHRSVYHALALLDLTPHFIPRPWLAGEGVTGPVLPETVGKALKAHPEIKTVCITSPTYYGVLSDIPAIAGVCRTHGAKLMVDGAHGAHLPFLGYTGYQAADVVVMSAHKTLPAPGQTALLLANGFGLDQLQRWGSVYGTSSPSYVLMSALDAARDYMEGEGTARYLETVRLTEALRGRWPALAPRSRRPSGPRPAHPVQPRRLRSGGRPAGAGDLSGDGRRRACGVHPHLRRRPGGGGTAGAGFGGHGPHRPLSAHTAAPGTAPGRPHPPPGPVRPSGAGSPVPERGPGVRRTDRPLSPRRTGHRPWGAD